MNIKFVVVKFDQDGGGSNQSLDLLSRSLSRQHEVSIITLRPDLNDIPSTPVQVEEIPCSSWYHVLKTCKRTLEAKEETTDIYHIFSPVLHPSAGTYRQRGGNTPVVGRLNTYSLFCTNPSLIESECYKDCSLTDKIRHDDEPLLSKPKKIHKYVFNNTSLRFSSGIDRYFAISPSVERIYRDAGLASDIAVVPNFYDPEFINTTEDIQRSEKETTTRSSLLFAGRLVKEKGVQHLIEAFSRINHQNASLTIVGDGPQRHDLEQLSVELSPSGNIQFEGWVPYDELSTYYKEATLFVHPSLWPEPFGRTILEALQCGVPLVVSDVGAPPWIAQDAAITFEPGSVTELTKAIKRAQEPTRYSEMQRACDQRVSEFSPGSVLGMIEKNYRELTRL